MGDEDDDCHNIDGLYRRGITGVRDRTADLVLYRGEKFARLGCARPAGILLAATVKSPAPVRQRGKGERAHMKARFVIALGPDVSSIPALSLV